jgi:cell surface protein SprA
LLDVFAQQNSLDFGTSRPLWKGAKIDLKWQVGWTINKSTSLVSDRHGNTAVSFISETGTLSRTFLSLPPVLLFKGFNNGIKKVHELYNPNASDPVENLSNAFVKGFETLPLAGNLSLLSKVMKYIPRPNWHITWNGLQDLFFFKKIADNISLDHSYTSTYTEGWIITPDGQKQMQTQRIEYGFLPLVGLNFTFSQLWNGSLVASIKYSTRTSYDLGISTRNIIESFSKDIGINAGYSKSGFEIPFFGVSLKNDIEFNFSYTKSRTASTIYSMTDFTEAGVPQDGTTRTILGPTVKYTISSRVQLSVFYTRTTVTPEGASRIPPSVQNQAGLDVHITIQ